MTVYRNPSHSSNLFPQRNTKPKLPRSRSLQYYTDFQRVEINIATPVCELKMLKKGMILTSGQPFRKQEGGMLQCSLDESSVDDSQARHRCCET
jgi:hypothetical protein